MERVPAGSVSLAVREWPGGLPPIVCVHGLTANHTCWASLAGLLSPRYRVIAYDLRGRGDSDKPETGYSLEHHARDLVALLDHYAIDRAVIMGHSLGAAIGLSFAVRHPERVRRLILVDGGFDVRAEVLDSLAPAMARLGVEFPSLPFFLQLLHTLPMFAGRWNDSLTQYFTYDVEEVSGGGVRSKVSKRTVEEEISNLARERLWVWHHEVKVPTLVLRAPEGLMTATDCLMTEEEAEAITRAIPDCRLEVIPGTNHYTILLGDNPALRRALGSFLDPDVE